MMRKSFLKTLIALFIGFVLLPLGVAQAVNITYKATDLVDSIPGQDLWRYDYWVSDYSFDQDYGFTIYFDYTLYSDLEDPPPFVNADWDPIVWQPDPAIPDDGAYDALALVDGASLADRFTVSFVWLGSGTPGPQYFEVYDPSFNTVASGQTAPVPEPATIFLVGFGILGVAGFKNKLKITRK